MAADLLSAAVPIIKLWYGIEISGFREFGRNDFFLEPGYIFSHFWARQLARFSGGFLVFKGHNSKVAEAFSQEIHRYQKKELI